MVRYPRGVKKTPNCTKHATRQRGKWNHVFQKAAASNSTQNRHDLKSYFKFPYKVLQRVLSKRGSTTRNAANRSDSCLRKWNRQNFFSQTRRQHAESFTKTFSERACERAKAKNIKITRNRRVINTQCRGEHANTRETTAYYDSS